MSEPRRAFITGITGQDGSYLAEFLLERGYRGFGLVRRASTHSLGRVANLRERVERLLGTGGMGRAAAECFAADGARVAVFGRTQAKLDETVERLREIRRTPPGDRLVTISAADPLNLTGIITPGDRLRTVASNRIVYLRGVPVSAMEGDMLRALAPVDPAIAPEVAAAAAGRRVPVLSGYVGRI